MRKIHQLITNKFNHTYSISEYGLIGTDNSVIDYNNFLSAKVDPVVYAELEEFAKTEYGKDIFTFSGNGQYLQAKSYVGTIQTKSGYSIEILPKVYSGQEREDHTKEIFLELLRMLYKLPSFKHVEKAHFQIENMPLLEIFISMFLDEINLIIKKGIKSDYIGREDNLHYLKGKILMREQIKHNYIHKERFYVDYDEYTPNRVENRLIKTTLKYLLHISSSFENIRLIRMYQEHMYSVDYSFNYDSDFRACRTNTRGMEHYKNALIWAKIFLKKESFSSFSGDTIAFAILYPMEKLFENYVEHKLSVKYPMLDIITQSGEQSFVTDHNDNKLFGVRPDILIKKDNEVVVVADAKWKIINENKSFSQSDFYQLYTYKHIYSKKQKNVKLRLYYPMSESLTKCKKFKYFDMIIIIAIPLDLNEIIKDRYESK